ncbi:TonB-dependent receptor [Parapedobacter sp. 10938]|uniref:TonB-dependent receptor n=1 Tax=Parapedobacter flavus TaxID=3110225 RepID=UPI002DB8A629|nr:TonB-dependent receptor [Parapedobacter sp. 10938]MEC3879696.1 TonB-dependent receptor [Parapedobacter sp. 10938]
MRSAAIFIVVGLLAIVPSGAFGQASHSIAGTVVDKKTIQPISFITIRLNLGDKHLLTITHEDGSFRFTGLAQGNYLLEVKTLGFAVLTQSLEIPYEDSLHLLLEPAERPIDEVYVTASEATDLTAASVIDRKAMELLQPASFTDLLELLPGGQSADPLLTEANRIHLREVGLAGRGDYETSSLGTAFVIDGAQINTNANLQSTVRTAGENQVGPDYNRSAVNAGVDMRFITTDDIETVKVVRGIPSVEYGDLTSGLIEIERRKGARPYTLRAKADGFSKLVAIGKGFDVKKKHLAINLDAGFLDAKQNPTNNFETYQRINASLRTTKDWLRESGKLRWNAALDYQTNIDRDKVDPDNGYAPVDRYRSTYNRYGLYNQLQWSWKEHPLWQSLEVTTNVNYQQDEIDQVKWIQARSATILANALEEGAHDAHYMTPSYAAHLWVGGRPLTAMVKAKLQLHTRTGGIRHAIKLGAESNYSKNFGDGEVYDLDFPPNQLGTTGRPRAFRDIPAMHTAALYGEDLATLALGAHRLSARLGIRGMRLLNLPNDYDLTGKVLLDPRVNLRWNLPAVDVGGQPLWMAIGGGYGRHSKTPTLQQLYPAPQYVDFIQLNFYHNNPEYRKANVMTYIVDRESPALQAAVNHKWEVFGDWQWLGNRLSITYFYEYMGSAFRSENHYLPFTYRQYDGTSIDAGALTAPPQLDDFEYREVTEYEGYGKTGNNSTIEKKGLEFQFASRRMTLLNMRMTLNGAWFHTKYRNTGRYGMRIPVSAIDSNGDIYQYVGTYEHHAQSYDRQLFNTNLTADGYLPRIGLHTYVSVQSEWFQVKQTIPRTGIPVAYQGIDGQTHPYTETEANDPVLQWLVDPVTDAQFRRRLVPFATTVNFKAAKVFRDQIRVSMFVNRVLVYSPDYESYGVRYSRRDTQGPYFGMELNFNF